MTVPALSNTLKALLTRAGVENPDGDAGEILCAALGCTRTELLLRDREISDEAYERALKMARRRSEGEPIQYVIGTWSFMGREYKVGRGVLIPRDDTEVVVREALDRMRDVPHPEIVDLCSGSGIIAVTLSKELKDAEVSAVEKSGEAFAYLTENVRLNDAKIRLIHADLNDCADDFADGSLSMIVSNPPYIKRDELPTLQSEVQYEPSMALDGGESGYDFYEAILRLWSRKLKKGGCIAFEIGEGQFQHIKEMLMRTGYTDIEGTLDIQGITRAVTALYRE